jgi:hypothetical protein
LKQFSRCHPRNAGCGCIDDSAGTSALPVRLTIASTLGRSLTWREIRMSRSSVRPISPRSNIQCAVPDSASPLRTESGPPRYPIILSLSKGRADMRRLGLRPAPAIDELPPGDRAARVIGMQHRAAKRPVAERAVDQRLNDGPLDLERHLRVLHAVKRREIAHHRHSRVRVRNLLPQPQPCDKRLPRKNEGHSSPIRNAAINASCGMDTFPHSSIRALPFFCFSSNFVLLADACPRAGGDRRPRPEQGQATPLAVTSMRIALIVSRAICKPTCGCPPK